MRHEKKLLLFWEKKAKLFKVIFNRYFLQWIFLITLIIKATSLSGGVEGKGSEVEEEEEEEEDEEKEEEEVAASSKSAKKMATRENSISATHKISKLPAMVTPSKGEGARKKLASRKGKYTDHFSFTPEQTEEATAHLNMYGFVKLHPNPAFKARTTHLIKRLDDQASLDGTSLDKVLRLHVVEAMSTALGDNKRKMQHERNYPTTRGKHVEFFDIMRELNTHFCDGNQSALRMLTSNLQKKKQPLEIFHCPPTEVLDIISLPGAMNQNEHLDAFFEKVKWLPYLLSIVFLLIVLCFEGPNHSSWTCQHNFFFTSRRTDRHPRYSNACAKLAPKWPNLARVDSSIPGISNSL